MEAHAAKKQRPEDEAEEEMHLAFRGAANALSHVYTKAMAHQKASFLAGERRAMESVYRWIFSQLEGPSEVSVADILALLKKKIEQRAEDIPGSSQHPSPQPAHNFSSANVHSNSFSFGHVAATLNSRMDQTEETRIVGVSNALSDPFWQNLQENHLVQSSGYGLISSLPNENGSWNSHSLQNQEFMRCSSNDPSMAMNHDAS